MIDDAGMHDVGYLRSDTQSAWGTPVIDTLAKSGVILDKCDVHFTTNTEIRSYYTHPTCTPSRAALMTGRYAFNTGIVFPLMPLSPAGLNYSTPTLAEELHARGYL